MSPQSELAYILADLQTTHRITKEVAERRRDEKDAFERGMAQGMLIANDMYVSVIESLKRYVEGYMVDDLGGDESA